MKNGEMAPKKWGSQASGKPPSKRGNIKAWLAWHSAKARHVTPPQEPSAEKAALARLKLTCRQETKKAIRLGVLLRKPCEVCGEEKSEVHHTDYTKPLEVQWLCFQHHFEAHGWRAAARTRSTLEKIPRDPNAPPRSHKRRASAF